MKAGAGLVRGYEMAPGMSPRQLYSPILLPLSLWRQSPTTMRELAVNIRIKSG